jgi:RNA polymerase sigma-70 factor (ECF subfamily)
MRIAAAVMNRAPSTAADPALAAQRELQDRFVRENLRRIFGLIYRIVGNTADAQDLTQETFIKALQRQEQLKDLEKAAHWLSRIATNTALDHLRRNGRSPLTELDEIPDRLSVARDPSPEQRMLREERRERIEEALQVLTPRERTALLLRDVEDLPAEEVAAHLECSKATVRSHIANARVKFKRFLDRNGRPPL